MATSRCEDRKEKKNSGAGAARQGGVIGMEKWFDTYVSNTMGGAGNQLYFATEGGDPMTGRVCFRATAGGTYDYSLLFSNIIDSTHRAGDVSHGNLICGEWEILGASIGVCGGGDPDDTGEAARWFPVTFAGKRGKTVMPGEFFTTDPVELTAEKGDLICLRMGYRGEMIPCHPESCLPMVTSCGGEWVPDRRMPVPGMVGCRRNVKARIGFLGDSITQGIGVRPGTYAHWPALVSDALGDDYSFWNLGIGCARCQDAASDGAWLYKAKHMDALVVTLGSNDVSRGRTVEQMAADFERLLGILKKEGIRVFLQSVPPFDWREDNLVRWKKINGILRSRFSREADGFLDVVPFLTDADRGEGMSKYGTHPDEEGCRIWADTLLPPLRRFLDEMDR